MINDTQAMNTCLAAPGLAISGAGGTTAKYANTFNFKANTRVSPSITTANAPALTGAITIAPLPNGTAVTPAALAIGFSRIYALIATLPITGSATATPTFSWIASADFANTTDVANSGTYVQPNQSNQTIVGYVTIANNSASAFVPGTTALDAGSGLVVTYRDNYSLVGA